jgi:hypothetical protein
MHRTLASAGPATAAPLQRPMAAAVCASQAPTNADPEVYLLQVSAWNSVHSLLLVAGYEHEIMAYQIAYFCPNLIRMGKYLEN